MKTLLVIDGNSILNRAFYGIRPLTNAAGLYTHAVYGMMNIVLKHLEERKPDYAAVAFDRKAPTFRHIKYADYKGTRKGMPEELAVQLPYAKKAMEALGLRDLEIDGYEADDILGTCAFWGESQGDVMTYLVTGDRDSFQLIRDNTHVLLASTGDTIEFDRAKFHEKYGVSPEQFVDVKALMGDSSDNIPGVAGIGEKTALKLIADYGSLDEIYKEPERQELSAGVRKKLVSGRDSAYLSKFLAEINCQVPLSISLEDLAYYGPVKEDLKPLLTELELTSMIKRLKLDQAVPSDEGKSFHPNSAVAADTPTEEACGTSDGSVYARVPSDVVDRCDIPSFDKGGLYFDDEKIYLTDGKVYYVSLIGNPADWFSYFNDERKCFAVHDAKAFYEMFGDVSCRFFDVRLAAYVVDSSDGHYELPRLALRYLGVILPEEYNHAALVNDLVCPLTAKLEESKQFTLFEGVEMPLAKVLSSMETAGFRVDREGLAAYSEKLSERCREEEEAIYFEAGHPFNINSPKQLGQVLFEELKLPVTKKTKTGYSTDAETLEKLRPYHTIIDRISEYRQVAKLRSTYTEGLLKVADKEGRVHSRFNQTVTATGRLSSSEPNLQNIPIRTPLGRELRRFFLPKNDDYVLVDADYSQIELRLLAAIAGDETMIGAFCRGDDIHARTASQVFGVPIEAVTEEQRKRAKAVNFGIVYGIGGFSLGQDIGVSKYEADRYIAAYLGKYPEIGSYLDDVVAQAKKDGYVTTIFGRRRYIPELSSSKKQMQAFGKRVAMNSPIQGAAADLIKMAMIRVSKALEESGIDARLILQVHDELILEAHHNCAKQAADILKREMEGVASLAVPLLVDVGIGDTWLDC